MSSALIIFAVIGLTFVAIKVILPIGEATDKRTQAQTAADAAALAGANAIADAAVSHWGRGFRNPSDINGWAAAPVGCSLGFNEARQYADYNGASLPDYGWCNPQNHVHVRVQLRDTATDGQNAEARASAGLGAVINGCRLPPAPTPPTTTTTRPTTTTTTSRPTRTTTPPPPPDRRVTATCGTLRVDFIREGATGRYRLSNAGTVRDRLKARLVD